MDPTAPRQAPPMVPCPRCRVRQTDTGRNRCVSCGARLHRWVARPPAGGRSRKVRPGPAPAYPGPPAYRDGHPHWAFPPVVWQEAEPAEHTPRRTDPSGALRMAAWFAATCAVVSLIAAAVEGWRFNLMLEGRTKVLAGTTVRTSDVFVAAAGAGALAVAIAALLVAAVALVRTHPVAALRLGATPSRSTSAVAARLLVPGWNLYGAGQIVTEIDRMLTAKHASPERPVRACVLTGCWWASWILSAILVLIALARGLGGSLQAIADTVELHLVVDLAAAFTAGLGAAMLLRFAGLLRRRAAIPDGWMVRPPAPTRAEPVRS